MNTKQWPEECQVNYIDAIKGIVGYPIGYKIEIYECIFRIIQHYIPNILYKYYALNEDDSHEKLEVLNKRKLQTLRQQQIYLASYAELNDPFEGKGFFTSFGTKQDCFLDESLSNLRLTSMTNSGINSMPMWAHYANNHHGFCVSYDMDKQENITLRSSMFHIEYTTNRVDITTIMQEQIEKMRQEKEKIIVKGKNKVIIYDETLPLISLLLVNIKHKFWEYEKEFRYTTCLPAGSDGLQPYYITAIPKEIYIGSNCKDCHADDLINIGKLQKIPVYRMEINKMASNFCFCPTPEYLP